MKYKFTHFLVTLFLVFACIQFMPIGPAFAKNMFLNPALVWNGEVWRIFTYAFLQHGNLLSLILHILCFLYLALPLENEWGTRFFIAFYFISVLGGSIVALFLGVPLVDGFHIDVSIIIMHGFLYPESKILLFFLFPIRVRTLGVFFASLLTLMSMQFHIFKGIAFLCGMGSGILFYFLYHSKHSVHIPKVKKTISDAEELFNKAYEIAQKRQKNQATQKEIEWIENLDKDVVPQRELCSPYTFSPTCAICPPCSCYKICLKRNIQEEFAPKE